MIYLQRNQTDSTEFQTSTHYLFKYSNQSKTFLHINVINTNLTVFSLKIIFKQKFQFIEDIEMNSFVKIKMQIKIKSNF